MSTTVARLDQHTVVIDKETYAIGNVPASSKLVAKAKDRLLAEIQLDDLMDKLHLVGKLLFVAYNGVASQPELRGQISTLQVDYMKLCSKSQTTMQSFEDNCEELLTKLGDLFTYLLSAKEQTALLYIGEIAEIATLMADQAKALETEFEEYSAEAAKALARAEVAKGTEEAKRAALATAKQNYEALIAGAKELVEQMAAQKAKLQKLYEDAKEAAEKHENRAFAMGLVGAIFGGIGQGLGAASNMYMAAKMPVALPAAPPPAPPQAAVGTSAEAEKAKAELDKAAEGAKTAKDEVAAAEKELVTATGNVETLKKELSVAAPADGATATGVAGKDDDAGTPATGKADAASTPDAGKADTASTPVAGKTDAASAPGTDTAATPNNQKELKGKLSKAVEAVSAAEKSVATKKTLEGTAVAKEAQAKTNYELKAAALKGLGTALSSTGDSAAKASESYAAIATSYNEERKKYLEMLLQQQIEEGKALASIKEYGVRMQNLTVDVEVATVVISALHQALAALKQIVVILVRTTELWTRMANSCSAMSRGSKSLKTKIQLWMKEEKPEDRIDLYVGGPFLRDAVTLYAGFRALQMVTKQYAASAQRIKAEVQGNVQKNVTTGEMLKLAIEEGKVLSASADAGIQGNKTEVEAIKAEQQKAA